MAEDSPPPLSDDEFAALREATKGLIQGNIRQEHAARLVELGYLTRRLGSLVVTTAGNRRLTAGQ